MEGSYDPPTCYMPSFTRFLCLWHTLFHFRHWLPYHHYPLTPYLIYLGSVLQVLIFCLMLFTIIPSATPWTLMPPLFHSRSSLASTFSQFLEHVILDFKSRAVSSPLAYLLRSFQSNIFVYSSNRATHNFPHHPRFLPIPLSMLISPQHELLLL